MNNRALMILASTPPIYALGTLYFDSWLMVQRALPAALPVTLFILLSAIAATPKQRLAGLSPLLLCWLGMLAPDHKGLIAAGWMAITASAAMFVYFNPHKAKLSQYLGYGLLAWLLITIAVIAGHIGDPDFDWITISVAGDSARLVGAVSIIGSALLLPRQNAWWLAIPFIALIFWSGSRGAFYAVGVATIVGAILLIRKDLLFRLAVCLPLGAALSLLHVAPHPNMGLMRFLNVGNIDNVERLTSGRTVYWQQTLDALLSSPFTIRGQDQAWAFLEPPAPHVHSDILQALFDFGIVLGGLIIATLACVGLRASFDTRSNNQHSAWLVMSALSLLLVVETTFYWPMLGLFWAICAAVCIDTPVRDQFGTKRRTDNRLGSSNS